MPTSGKIPEQIAISWSTSLVVSWAGMKRRFLRSLITMAGVVLAIAFLTYMLTFESVTESLALAAPGDRDLALILQQAGVDIFGKVGTDSMTVLLLGLSLLTCTVGIINSMLMSVTERVREIGTLKCLGARDHFIVKTYFIESTCQGICGALIGMVVGLLVALGVALNTYGTYTFTHFPGLAVLKAIGVAFIAGSMISVIAAIAPAYTAARKEPVEALRVEE